MMVENVLLALLLAFVLAGFVLMCVALIQVNRHGFKGAAVQAWVYASFACFAVALAISFVD